MKTISCYYRSNGVVNIEAWGNTSLDFGKNWAISRLWEWDSIGNRCFYRMW